MPDKRGSVVIVERQRRIENDPTTWNSAFENKRAEHSGLTTIHFKTLAGVVNNVLTVPTGYIAFITKLNWEWPDGDGPHYMRGGIGGIAPTMIYWQGIIFQLLPDDLPGLDWGDGSFPVVYSPEGILEADCTACLSDSELTITYYLERLM